jgi:hypothetical protein
VRGGADWPHNTTDLRNSWHCPSFYDHLSAALQSMTSMITVYDVCDDHLSAAALQMTGAWEGAPESWLPV